MIGKQNRSQGELFFIAGSLGDLVPGEHVLKRVDAVLDLRWLREDVRDCYDERLGRPSIDPESAVRLMLAGFFEGIVEDRKLMRAAEVNIAMRWFAGYKLTERLPDHSSLTRIRNRWGPERFRRIMERTVDQCVAADLVDGETVHTDATPAEPRRSHAPHVHTSPVARRRNPRRSEDSARPAAGGASRAVERRDSGLSDRRRPQPEAPGGASLRHPGRLVYAQRAADAPRCHQGASGTN